MWLDIALIVAGIILGASALVTLPAIGDNLAGIIKQLRTFQVMIGIVVLMFGVNYLLQLDGVIAPILAILDGLLLLTAVLPQIPKIGDDLQNFSKKLMPYETILGITSIALGILWWG